MIVFITLAPLLAMPPMWKEPEKTEGEKSVPEITEMNRRHEESKFSKTDDFNPVRANEVAIKEEKEKTEEEISLVDFQTALERYPEASRFVLKKKAECINQQMILVAQDVNLSEPTAIVQAEDQAIMAIFKNLLEEEYPSIDIKHFFVSEFEFDDSRPLSAQLMRQTFEFIEKQVREKDLSVYQSEKKSVGELIRKMAAQPLNVIADDHYNVVDQMWNNSLEAWQDRFEAQKEKELKEQILQHAKSTLVKVKEIQKAIDIDATFLARLSQCAEKVINPLSYVPGPIPLGGIAHATSTIADFVNQMWFYKDEMIASYNVLSAEAAVEKAIDDFNEINQLANWLQSGATKREEEALCLEQTAIQVALKALRPPIMSFQETDWKNWALHLLQSGKGDLSQQELLTNHGLSDPAWALDQVLAGLKEKLIEQSSVILLKQEREKAFQELSKMEPALVALLTHTAQLMKEQAVGFEDHHYCKTRLKEIDEEIKVLFENPIDPNNATQLLHKEDEMSFAFLELKNAHDLLINIATNLSTKNQEIEDLERAAIPVRKGLIIAEKKLAIAQNRIQKRQENYHQINSFVLRLPSFREGIREFQLSSLRFNDPSKLILSTGPVLLTKFKETIGKALLHEARRIYQQQSPFQKFENPFAGAFIQKPAFLIPEVTLPNDLDRARWKAAEEAKELLRSRERLFAEYKTNHPELQAITTTDLFHDATKTGATVSAPVSFFRFMTPEEHDDEQGNESRSLKTHTDVKSGGSKNSSIYSQSIHSWSGSVLSGTSSQASKAERKRLHLATTEVTQAVDAWKQLVLQTEKERLAPDEVTHTHDQAFFDAWQEADEKAQAAEQKRKEEKEKISQFQKWKNQWEIQTVRWEVRAVVDRLTQECRAAKADELALEAVRNQNDSTWVKRFTALSNFQTILKGELKAAKREWDKLAREFIEATVVDKTLHSRALKRLQQKDQAINQLWQHVMSEDKQEEGEVQKEEVDQRKGDYHLDLMTKKSDRMNRLFAEIGQKNITLQRLTSIRRPNAQQRQERDRLSLIIDQLEQETLTKYREESLEEAYQEAQSVALEKKGNAEIEAWKKKVEKALYEEELVRQRLNIIDKNQKNSDFWLFRELARCKTIREIDQEAYDTFLKEVREFAEIRSLWRTSMQAQEQNATLQVLRAAHDHYLGHQNLWENLTSFTKSNYNESIINANEAEEMAIHNAIAEAERKTRQAHATVARRNASLTARQKSKRAALDAANKAEQEWVQQELAEDERARALKWVELRESERAKIVAQALNFRSLREKVTIAQKALYQISPNAYAGFWKENLNKVEDAVTAWGNALREMQPAISHLMKDATTSEQRAYQAWNHAHDAESWKMAATQSAMTQAVWEKASESYRQRSGLFQDPQQATFNWIQNREDIEHGKELWAAKALYAEALRRHGIAWEVKKEMMEKLFKGQNFSSWDFSLWKDVLYSTEQALQTFSQTLEAYQQGQRIALDRFKRQWDFSEIQESHDFWTLVYQAENSFVRAITESNETNWKESFKAALELVPLLGQKRNQAVLISKDLAQKVQEERSVLEEEQQQLTITFFHLQGFWKQSAKVACAKEAFLRAQRTWIPIIETMHVCKSNEEALLLLDHSEMASALAAFAEIILSMNLAVDIRDEFASRIANAAALTGQEVVDGALVVGGGVLNLALGALATPVLLTMMPDLISEYVENNDSSELISDMPRTILVLLSVPLLPFTFLIAPDKNHVLPLARALNHRTQHIEERMAMKEALEQGARAAIPPGSEMLSQLVSKSAEIFQSSLFYLKKIPSSAGLEGASQAAREVDLLATRCQETHWEAEAYWLAQLVREIISLQQR